MTTAPSSSTIIQATAAAPEPLPQDGLLAGKTVFMETLGCQMNYNDSELMMGLLEQQGMKVTYDPRQADLLMINTCQIRQHAEDKAFSYLGRWATLKEHRPHIKIAMTGCVAQQAKDSVFKRIPGVDFVMGTQNLHDLPRLAHQAFSGQKHLVAADKQKRYSTYDYAVDVAPRRENDTSAWVTIIEGCDYFCTYCVVPYTRGRQISRRPESILDEVNDLASYGFKEITLLGQTVDSYGKDFDDRNYGLADLLEALNEIDGIERIRFMTSHPLDLNTRIIQAIADLPKVMEYIHFPMQAGDDVVLERMKRGYTAQQYYDLVDKVRATIPNVAISGDYIVGFPGETDEQFQRSIDSVYRSQIDSANTAAYSPRKQTPAAIWEARNEGVIPDDVKRERLKLLNEAVSAQAAKNNAPYLGQTVEILVEGKSRRNPNRLMGRTRNNKVVNFNTPVPEHELVGKLINVQVKETYPFSLRAEHTPTPGAFTLQEIQEAAEATPALI